MKKKKKIQVYLWDQMVLIGFGLALFYTVFDSVLYIFLSYDVNFFQRLLGPDISAILSRIAILCLFVIFGSHAQITLPRWMPTASPMGWLGPSSGPVDCLARAEAS